MNSNKLESVDHNITDERPAKPVMHKGVEDVLISAEIVIVESKYRDGGKYKTPPVLLFDHCNFE